MIKDFVIRDIKTVEVLVDRMGPDIVNIIVNDHSAFPTLQYDTCFEVKCQCGKGVEFARNYLGVEPYRIVSVDSGIVKNK